MNVKIKYIFINRVVTLKVYHQQLKNRGAHAVFLIISGTDILSQDSQPID